MCGRAQSSWPFCFLQARKKAIALLLLAPYLGLPLLRDEPLEFDMGSLWLWLATAKVALVLKAGETSLEGPTDSTHEDSTGCAVGLCVLVSSNNHAHKL